MKAPTLLRLPLQVGTSAFWSLARSAALWLPSLSVLLVATPVVVAAALGAAWVIIDGGGDAEAAGFPLVIAIGIVGALWAIFRSALKHMRLALEQRASDVEMEGAELRIVGGHHDGLLVSLSNATCELRSEKKWRKVLFKDGKLLADDRIEIVELLLDGEAVATSARPIEQESLTALVDAIRTHAGIARGDQPAADADDRKPRGDVLTCPGCGAPAAPANRDAVTCRYCSRDVPVPRQLRARLDAQHDLVRALSKSEALLGELLDQPSARSVNGVMLALGVPIVLVWPAAAGLIYLLHRRSLVGAGSVLLVLVATGCAILALFFLMRSTLVNRQALSLISTRFAAYAPQKSGDPHTCRSCLAPLPEVVDHILVACAYCDAENVLGLDLRSEARQEARQARSLMSELGRRRGERLLWRCLAVAALLLLALVAGMVKAAFSPVG